MKRVLRHPMTWMVPILPLMLLCIVSASTAEDKKLPKLPKILPHDHKSYTVKLPKSKVSFDMVAIPGGAYLMGSPKSEKGRNEDEGPQHPVAVGPLWVGKCEVTWDEFDVYWQAVKDLQKKPKPKKPDADAITGPTPPYADETFGHGREGHPVLCISHHTAMEYCRWLSKATGHYYRLPTEAEWEWACRAGTTTAYSFGDDASKLGDYAWYEANSDEVTNKVGKKKPNPWGLYDMHGNVAEWCVDHYNKKAYSKYPTDKITLTPVVLPTKARFPHVARGGSWAHKPKDLRSASRLGSTPAWLQLDPQRPQSIWWLTSAEFVGFRVVRAVKEQDNLKKLRSKITRESPNYIDE